MAADVIEGRHLALLAAHDDDRVAIDFVKEVIARIGYLARVTCKQPASPPDPIHFGAVQQLIVVQGPRQPMTRTTKFDQLLQVVQLCRAQR